MFFKVMSSPCSSSPTKPRSHSKPFTSFSRRSYSQCGWKNDNLAPMTRTQSKRQMTVLFPGEWVELLVGNIPVGEAIIRKGNNVNLCRKRNGQEFISLPVQDLIIVQKVVIVNRMKAMPYTYHFLGPEWPPSPPKGLYQTVLYVWD